MIYHGLELFGGGRTLAALILGAIAAFIIDRRFERAATYAACAAVLAFFGFINGTGLGFANSAPVALGSVLLASVCLLVGRVRQSASAPLVATAEAGAEPAE